MHELVGLNETFSFELPKICYKIFLQELGALPGSTFDFSIFHRDRRILEIFSTNACELALLELILVDVF